MTSGPRPATDARPLPDRVDWQAPWYRPLQPLRAAWPGTRAGAVAAALNARAPAGVPVRFVPQSRLPPEQPYETFIFSTGQVPTRDNWHDFFNGLIWLRLPRTKARLNALQAAEIARRGTGGTRGPLRDAATLFDENALLLHAPDALWQALAAQRWQLLFGPLRPLWRHARMLVFGHSALEKLLAPYKSICVHVWRVAPAFDPAGDLRALDAWLVADLTPGKLAAKPFAPLPVLGIPGWWPANADAAFYKDPHVFRARRRPPGA